MNYYLVVMPSKESKLAEIRHQYLHFLLDPLAVKFAPLINQKSELKGFVRAAPQLGSDFKADFPLFVTECLIRAAELRMGKRPEEEAQKSIEELTAGGLVLVPYFYEALVDYEKQDASMNVVYREMIRGIDLRKEKSKLVQLKFAPKEEVAGAESLPARSEEERLLDQGDNFVFEGKYREARAVYQNVLEQINARSARALFGVAVAASNMQKPITAEEYFLKTLEVARDLRIVSWSHIYLGRLLDLQGKREEALGHYRAASLTASTYPDALRAVQNGMQKAFGSSE
jgi:tetratricopeptide (TPR) repeat protein